MLGLFNTQVFFPHLRGGEDADEFSALRSLLDLRAPCRLLPLYQANHARDLKAEFARRLDCLDRRRPRGADIINNYNVRTRLSKAFDALPRAVLLLFLADDESVNIEATGIHWLGTRRRPGLHLLRSQQRHRGDDRISAQRHAADCSRVPALLADQVK